MSMFKKFAAATGVLLALVVSSGCELAGVDSQTGDDCRWTADYKLDCGNDPSGTLKIN